MKQAAYINLMILLISFFPGTNSNAQTSYQQFYLKRENFESNLSTLKNKFSNKKVIPSEIELECLTALSFYPELKNTDIEFRFGDLNFTMISKPRFKSILKDRERR